MNEEKTPQSLDENDYKPRIVKLNVGGKKFETHKDTLVQHSEFFRAKFEKKFFNDDGEIFIDRNGDLFAYILDYMRSQELPELSDELRSRLSIEADYFLMKGLEEKLQKGSEKVEKYTYDVIFLSKMTWNDNSIRWILERKDEKILAERFGVVFLKTGEKVVDVQVNNECVQFLIQRRLSDEEYREKLKDYYKKAYRQCVRVLDMTDLCNDMAERFSKEEIDEITGEERGEVVPLRIERERPTVPPLPMRLGL